MASRKDLAGIVRHLKDLAPFRDYVNILQDHRDETVKRLLTIEASHASTESIRGEARAYDVLLNEISKAIKDLQ